MLYVSAHGYVQSGVGMSNIHFVCDNSGNVSSLNTVHQLPNFGRSDIRTKAYMVCRTVGSAS